MFDPFGTRRKLVVNTKNFQKNLILLKDFSDLIKGMNGSRRFSVTLDRSNEFCDYITLNLSTYIIDDELRSRLNYFSNVFYERRFPFSNTEAQENWTTVIIDNILGELFPNHKYRVLYQKLVDSGYLNPCDFIIDCFGISKSYIPTDDEVVDFLKHLNLKTCFSNAYHDGNQTVWKDKFDRIDERDFYAKILLEELKKL